MTKPLREIDQTQLHPPGVCREYVHRGTIAGRATYEKPNAEYAALPPEYADIRELKLASNYRGTKYHVKWLRDPQNYRTPTVANCSPSVVDKAGVFGEVNAAPSITPEQAEQFSTLFGSSADLFQALMRLTKAVRNVIDKSAAVGGTDAVQDTVWVSGEISRHILDNAVLALYAAAGVPKPTRTKAIEHE